MAACGKPAPTPGPQPSEPSTPAGVKPTPGVVTVNPRMTMTVARYATGESRYAIERVDTLTFQYPNSVQTQVVQRSAWVRVSIAAGQPALVTLTVDSVRAGTISRDSLKVADGFRWTGQLVDGRIVDGLTPVRRDALAEGLLSNSLNDILIALPEGGARGGFSWRDTLEVSERVAGADIPTQMVRDVDGRVQGSPPELALESRATLEGKGSASRFGEEMTVTLSGTRTRTHQLTQAGVINGVTGRDSLALSFDVPSVGQTVPATQLARVRIERTGR